MDIVSEIKKGRGIKIVTCANRPCSNCIFSDYSGWYCPGARLCTFLDKCADDVFFYFVFK